MLARRCCVTAFVTRCTMASIIPGETGSSWLNGQAAYAKLGGSAAWDDGPTASAEADCWAEGGGLAGCAASGGFPVCAGSLVRSSFFGGWLLAATWTARFEGVRTRNVRRSDIVRTLWQEKTKKQNWQNRNCNEHVNCPDTRVGARNGLGKENLSTMKLTLISTFLNDNKKITLYNVEYTTRSEDKVQQNYKPQGIHLAKQLKDRGNPLQWVIHHMNWRPNPGEIKSARNTPRKKT